MYSIRTNVVETLLLASILISFLVPLAVYGQAGDISIVSTYTIEDGEIESGDIISFDTVQNIFYRSNVTADKNMFGVVIENPVVVFRSEAGTIPVAQSGAVLVNATTINGPISIGDLVTSSSIVGNAQRYNGEGDKLGVALEPLSGEGGGSVLPGEGQIVIIGVILVELDIGPPEGGSVVIEGAPTIVIQESGDVVGPGLVAIFRYLAAVIFAIGSLYLSFKYFGQNFTQGIVSIGRNPLAKSTIQAMVALNVILILIVAIGSFFVSIVILFLPL